MAVANRCRPAAPGMKVMRVLAAARAATTVFLPVVFTLQSADTPHAGDLAVR